MANSNGRTLLLAVVLMVASGFASSQAKYQHPGRVRDAVTKRPVNNAFAVASVEAIDCETGTALHRELTNGAGEFRFEVPSDKASFQARYCRNGYASRYEPANSNKVDDSPVNPEPIDLIPIMNFSQPKKAAIVQGVVVGSLADLRADLMYFRSADPEAFQEAIKQLPERLRKIVNDLLEVDIERGESERSSG